MDAGDGRVGFVTSSQTWKAKRIGERILRKVKAKYGYQLRIIELLHAIPGGRTGHPNDCAIIVSVGDSDQAAHAAGDDVGNG